jgi:hypothetical protein
MTQSEQEMMDYYNKRKRIFQNNQLRGSIGPIIFPEDLVNIPVDELVAINISNIPDVQRQLKKFFLKIENTLHFFALEYDNLNEELIDTNLNDLSGRIMYVYKKILNNDDLFNLFFDKMLEMKKILNQSGRAGVLSLIQQEPIRRTNTIRRQPATSKYVIPNTLKPLAVPEFPDELIIKTSDSGFEPIEGEKNVLEHLDESGDNIVFIIQTKDTGNNYFLTSKELLNNLVSNRENIQYECLINGPSILEIRSTDVNYENPLFRTTSFGSPIPYVHLHEFKFVLDSDKQIFVFSDEPLDYVRAVASDSIINGANASSGDHCQFKEGDKERPIYTLFYVDRSKIEEPNKRIKRGGKKNTRRHKTRRHKTRRHKTRKHKTRRYK